MLNKSNQNVNIPEGTVITVCEPSKRNKPRQKCTTASKSDALRHIRTVAATNAVVAYLTLKDGQ